MRGARERLRLTPQRRLLLSLLVCSGLAGIGATTFATLNATVVNTSDTFRSGTLVLKDTVGATVCLSTGSGVITDTNSTTCAGNALGAPAGQVPAGTAVTQNVVLKNDGTIDAGTFRLWSTACSSAANPAETYSSTGDICTVTDLTIYDQTHSACVYPQTSGACTLTATKTLGNFVSVHGSLGAAAALTTLTAGSSSTFVFTTQVESAAANTMQGRLATIDFNWRLDQ